MDQIDLYYEVTREKLLNQESLNKEFGTKASSILGLGAALIGAATIILNLSDIKLGLGILAFGVFGVFILLVVAFVCTAVLSFLVLWPRSWGHGPTVSSLAKDLGYYEDRVLTKLVGDGYKQAVDSNWRARCLGYSPSLVALNAPLVNVLLKRRRWFLRWPLLWGSWRRYRRWFFGWWWLPPLRFS